MDLSQASIQNARDDEELFKLLSTALNELFPPDIRQDRSQFLAALAKAPRGLRAMAAVFDLDVSMALDDLAWYFANHNDDRLLEETVTALRELEALEAAQLFLSAWEIVKPYLPEIRPEERQGKDLHEFLERAGIQSRMDPLNARMWAICEELGRYGLLQYWLTYARKYPARCTKTS
jgi:hypothetical protein